MPSGIIPLDSIPNIGEISRDRIASGRPSVALTQFKEEVKKEKKEKAKYKIEVIFSSHRSSRAHKPSPFMLIIWESGKRFHGGGDEKMYWCGYDDCGKPMSVDNFGYSHVVCPHCQREMFLDPFAKKDHIDYLRRENRPLSGIDEKPTVVGEKMGNLIPRKLAELLAKTWYQLEGNADIYLKFSPYEIRYDKKAETTATIDKLERARGKREPVIYPMANIIRETVGGASLEDRIVTFLVA